MTGMPPDSVGSQGRKKIGISIPAIASAIIICTVAFAFMTPAGRHLAMPGFFCALIVLWLWTALWDRDGRIPLFDAGMLCAMATLIYTVYPLVNYWADGYEFGILADARLQQYKIAPAELGFFHWRHVLYLFFFVSFYWMFRGKGRLETGNAAAPDRPAGKAILAIFLLLTVYFYVLLVNTGVNYNVSYNPETYAKNFAAWKNLPLLLLQVSTKLWAILFLFKIALLYVVVSRCRDRKWLVILLIWVAVEIVQAVTIRGARTGLVLFLIAAVLLYHRLIKALSMRFLLGFGTSLLAIFIVLGLYRSYADVAALREGLSAAEGGILSGQNEFQALLGTAWDVMQRKEMGAKLPWYLYINDVINILPPRQVIPFEKIPASEWYLREIGMSGTGQGFMWGVITQCIVGLDWIELALRGALLGVILGAFHRWYVKNQTGFLATLIYLFFCLRIYYTFRDTTLSPLSDFVWVVIPFLLFMHFGKALFHRKPAVADEIASLRSQ